MNLTTHSHLTTKKENVSNSLFTHTSFNLNFRLTIIRRIRELHILLLTVPLVKGKFATHTTPIHRHPWVIRSIHQPPTSHTQFLIFCMIDDTLYVSPDVLVTAFQHTHYVLLSQFVTCQKFIARSHLWSVLLIALFHTPAKTHRYIHYPHIFFL